MTVIIKKKLTNNLFALSALFILNLINGGAVQDNALRSTINSADCVWSVRRIRALSDPATTSLAQFAGSFEQLCQNDNANNLTKREICWRFVDDWAPRMYTFLREYTTDTPEHICTLIYESTPYAQVLEGMFMPVSLRGRTPVSPDAPLMTCTKCAEKVKPLFPLSPLLSLFLEPYEKECRQNNANDATKSANCVQLAGEMWARTYRYLRENARQTPQQICWEFCAN